MEVVVVGCEKEPEREVIVASPSDELKQNIFKRIVFLKHKKIKFCVFIKHEKIKV